MHVYVGAYVRTYLSGRKKKHRALLATCERVITPGGCVLVFFTHNRPHLAQRDMEFFKMASEMKWESEKALTERLPVRVSTIRPGVSYSRWDSSHLNLNRYRYPFVN